MKVMQINCMQLTYIVRDTFVKLDAQWIMFHARQIFQQSIILQAWNLRIIEEA